tara:strand:- start:3349 stop:4083 length:735 start_codon:yes stop_codon:yes gene_type:complete
MTDLGDIYLITNIINEVKYVGQAVHFVNLKNNKKKKWGYLGRWNDHINKAKNYVEGVYKSTCRYLDSAIRKYGENNFKIEVLKVCKIEELNHWEEHYIKELNTLEPNGYNLTTGGLSHRKSESTKKLMSEIMKIKGGHLHTEETKKKISENLKSNSEFQKNLLERNKKKIGVPQAKQPRKNASDNDLPKYISSKKRKGEFVGYVVHPPKLKTKTFTNSINTPEENLRLAKEYLNDILNKKNEIQ